MSSFRLERYAARRKGFTTGPRKRDHFWRGVRTEEEPLLLIRGVLLVVVCVMDFLWCVCIKSLMGIRYGHFTTASILGWIDPEKASERDWLGFSL